MPFPGRQRDSARAADGGFAATFARHPARPRRGLIPGRRVWVTILGATTATAACALAAPRVGSIDLDMSESPAAGTVAERAGAYRVPAATPATASSPAPAPTPSPSHRTEPGRDAAAVARPAAVTPTRARTKTATSPSTSPSTRTTTTSGTRTSRGTVTSTSTRSTRRLPWSGDLSTTTRLLLKNEMTGLCADLPDDGPGRPDGRVQEFYCDGSSGDNQRWDLVVNEKNAGPHGADLFTVRNSKDGYCLDLPGYGPAKAGSNVTEWYCHPGDGDNQMWYLDRKSSGRFWIRNYSSSRLCLDVSGLDGSGGPNAGLTIFPCSLKDDHLWSFH